MSTLYLLLSIAFLSNIATSSADLDTPKGKLSGLERMNDPEYDECKNGCPITFDLNPQCASDGKSYPNTGSIECFAKCLKPLGEDLTIVSPGFCADDIAG